MRIKKDINFITLTCVIVVSIITLFFTLGRYFFNTITIKDIQIQSKTLTNAELSIEDLGLSDITLSKFLSSLQSFTLPYEGKLLSNSPRKNFTEVNLLKKLENANIKQTNLNEVLSKVQFKCDSPIEFLDKEFCYLTNFLIGYYKNNQVQKVNDLCGQDSLSVLNTIVTKNKDGVISLEIAFSVKVASIKDVVLKNLGQSAFELGDKIYFSAFCDMDVDKSTGELVGKANNVTLYGIDEHLTEKFFRAISIIYYLKKDCDLIFDYKLLSSGILDVFITAVNNLGKVGLYYNDSLNISYGNHAVKNNVITLMPH